MQLEHEPDVDGNIELSGKILYNTDKLIGHMNTEMKHSSLDLKSTVDLKTGMYSKMTYSGVLEILFRDVDAKSDAPPDIEVNTQIYGSVQVLKL